MSACAKCGKERTRRRDIIVYPGASHFTLDGKAISEDEAIFECRPCVDAADVERQREILRQIGDGHVAYVADGPAPATYRCVTILAVAMALEIGELRREIRQLKAEKKR